MATKAALDNLKAVFGRLDAVNQEKLLRKNLGEESLSQDLEARLEELDKLKHLVKTYAPGVHDEYIGQMAQALDSIAAAMNDQAGRASAEYIANRQGFLNAFDQQLDAARKWLTFFVTAAIIERGFLDDEGIRQEYQRTIERLKHDTDATLATVKATADEAVAGAKSLADEIEARARKTATGISVEQAQEQFTAATMELDGKVRFWGRMTIGSVALLVMAPIAFMTWPLPKDATWPEALYHTLLRVLVLGSVAALATFCTKLLRAHLHLREKNKHRLRVANSVESFVNSALEPQQRDLILAKLVESIVDYGDSGLVRDESSDNMSSTVSTEMVGRILAALTKRP